MTVSGGVINGAEWLIDDRRSYAAARDLSPRVGATYRLPTSPWRKVWHTVEGRPSTVAGARGLAVAHRNPPHLWAAPLLDWVGQTVPLDLSAYALAHPDGSPETNHRHAIQTEVFGFAREDLLRDPGIIRWLAARVLGPVLAAGVPINLNHVAPSDGSDAYGVNGSVRLSWSWWSSFDGQCGHQNVPGNVHWDPGRADYAAIARAATVTPPPPPPPIPPGDKMLYLVKVTGRTEVWLTDWLTRRKVNAEDVAVVSWISASVGRPISTKGGQPHTLSAAQGDVLDRIPAA